MYIPKHYQGKLDEEAISFMQRYNFGTIITSVDNLPIATHLPFIISQKDEQIVITSHFAKANEHWKHIDSNNNLIIFSEPHAYISPSNYDKKENVPTWNYISIHAYGRAKIKDSEHEVLQVLESMMERFEPQYKDQWNALSTEYRSNMTKGIVAFEIEVSNIQSKEKLSQNKKENERKAIIASLYISEDASARTVAEYMKLKEFKSTNNGN